MVRFLDGRGASDYVLAPSTADPIYANASYAWLTWGLAWRVERGVVVRGLDSRLALGLRALQWPFWRIAWCELPSRFARGSFARRSRSEPPERATAAERATAPRSQLHDGGGISPDGQTRARDCGRRALPRRRRHTERRSVVAAAPSRPARSPTPRSSPTRSACSAPAARRSSAASRTGGVKVALRLRERRSHRRQPRRGRSLRGPPVAVLSTSRGSSTRSASRGSSSASAPHKSAPEIHERARGDVAAADHEDLLARERGGLRAKNLAIYRHLDERARPRAARARVPSSPRRPRTRTSSTGSRSTTSSSTRPRSWSATRRLVREVRGPGHEGAGERSARAASSPSSTSTATSSTGARSTSRSST
jgi:hypothetical protein